MKIINVRAINLGEVLTKFGKKYVNKTAKPKGVVMVSIKNIFVLHTFVIILYGSLLPSVYADPVSKNQEKILCFEDRVDQGDQDANDRILSPEQAVKFKSYDCQDLSGKDVQKSDGRTKRILQYVLDGRNDGKITLTGKAQDKKAAVDKPINPTGRSGSINLVSPVDGDDPGTKTPTF